MRVLEYAAATLASVLVTSILSVGFLVVMSLSHLAGVVYWNQMVFFWFWYLIVATVFVPLFGIPAYVLLRKLRCLSTLSLAVTGFVLPIFIYGVIDRVSGRWYPPDGNYYGTYRQFVVEGEFTVWGWLRFFESASYFGVHGALVAIVFGYVMLLCTRRAM